MPDLQKILEAITPMLPPEADVFLAVNTPGDVGGFRADCALAGEPRRIAKVLRDFLSENPEHLRPAGETTIPIRPQDTTPIPGTVEAVDAGDVVGAAPAIGETASGWTPGVSGAVGGPIERTSADDVLGGEAPKIPVPPAPFALPVAAKRGDAIRSPREALRALADDMAHTRERGGGAYFALTPGQQAFFAPLIHLLLEVATRDPGPEMTRRALAGHRVWLEQHPDIPATDEEAEAHAILGWHAALVAALGS